jgi:cytochrome c oxidase cbb3-type subunit II
LPGAPIVRSETRLFAGALVMIAAATAALVALPYLQLHHLRPPTGLHPYTSAQLRGRQQYIREGCIYCHSQQPRDRGQAPDAERGWGRASVAADYFYDTPHLLGTMRTGPDLFNIGARQPSIDWHLGHLYQPRAYVPGSIMPSFPFLFEVKPKAEPGDRVVAVPALFAPRNGVVVARPAALDLASYLLSLDHTYPVVATETPSR